PVRFRPDVRYAVGAPEHPDDPGRMALCAPWRWPYLAARRGQTDAARRVVTMSQQRTPGMVVGALTTVLLLLVVNPWFELEAGTLRDVVTYGFWLSFIVLLVLLFMMRKDPGGETVEIEGPAFTRFLFSNSRAGLFWLPIRLFLGFAWLEAGWHKATSPGWLDGGTALERFWRARVSVPDECKPAITYDWYRDFLSYLLSINAEVWFAKLIVFGEIAV